MLREFSMVNADGASIESRYHPGKEQIGIFTRFLRVVSKKNSRDVEAGFNAVLNDFLGHAYSLGAVKPGFYYGLNDAEIEREFTAEERGEDIGHAPITRKHLTLVYSRG